jgi:colicin import membrane protein
MSDALASRDRRYRANRGFVGIVVVSLLMHVGIGAYVLWKQNKRPAVADFRDSIPVQLVALGKKRDPKLLPRKVEEPPPAPVEEQGVALDMNKDSTPQDPSKKKEKKPTEKKLSDAARRLLEGDNTKLEQALDKIEDREGDPDGDVHGTTTDNANAAAGYTRAIIKTLQSNYRLPETIPAGQRSFLKAKVLLYIERDGTISKYDFEEKHPNEIFMGALESLLKSIKLPPPPPAQADAYREGGVLVIFRP